MHSSSLCELPPFGKPPPDPWRSQVSTPAAAEIDSTTGGHAGIDPYLDKDTLAHIIRNVEAHIEAGLEYGEYPAGA